MAAERSTSTRATAQPADERPLRLDEVLLEELTHLTARKLDTRAVTAAADDSGRLRAVIDLIHERRLTALCLSGGGIRSATFNLGVLQELARAGALQHFDYLSSVSGGGYIASWLSSWLYRRAAAVSLAPPAPVIGTPGSPSGSRPLAGAPKSAMSTSPTAEAARAEVFTALGTRSDDPRVPEPAPIRHLRRYSNYLTPRVGLFSADTWTLLVTILRNMALNWLVILPVLAAVVAVPQLASATRLDDLVPNARTLFLVGWALGFFALFWMNVLRADTERPDHVRFRLRVEHRFLLVGLLPQFLAVPFLTGAALRAPASFEVVLPYCALWAIATPCAALIVSTAVQRWGLQRQRTYLRGDLAAAVIAGAVVALLYAELLTAWRGSLADRTMLTVVAPLLVLGPVLLGKTLFVGFASLSEQGGRPSEHADAEREWWARWSAWHLIVIVTWTVGSALSLYGPLALDRLTGHVTAGFWSYLASGGLTSAVGWIASALGKSSKTAAQPERGDAPSGWRAFLQQAALPLFCLLLTVVLATAVRDLLVFVTSLGEQTEQRNDSVITLLVTVGLAAFGIGMGRVININRFSLQAMYRNRLIRAYLGASNEQRQPNPFTGFDPDDNLRMTELRDNRPLPIVNIACNLVGGSELAWQQRKASSFTVSPLHCGVTWLGYRRTAEYGGKRADGSTVATGITLGTAMATSGAAANPNMGYNSSPLLTFVMTLFNARLGIWLGNPGPAGRRTFTRNAPHSSAALIFAEAFGLTDANSSYVNLSDGGHFDNLGLYEMVVRRVQTIVVCDAGCDPAGDYDDLGNAVRKIRTDLGISIDFKERIFIKSRADAPAVGVYCGIGTIEYGGGRAGTLLYIKPTLCNLEPYDVYNYSRSSPTFPHESTADQWFSETQFESYRALGWTTIRSMCSGPVLSLDEFVAAARTYIAAHPQT